MITWWHEVTWLIKNDISPFPRGPWLPNMTATIHWVFWRFDHVIKLKCYISTSAEPMATKLTEWWVRMRAYYPSSHPTCWSRGHIWSHDKWKMFNSLSRDLLLSNLTEGWLMIRSNMSNHKATYSFHHVVTWVHETNEFRYIFTSTRPSVTEINRVMACNEELPLTK